MWTIHMGPEAIVSFSSYLLAFDLVSGISTE